jgi:SHS2 domain-containing protein
MTPRPDWLDEIDHTGDVGIRVTAPTIEQLYERAAVGMFWVLTDVEAVRDREATTVAVTARDREAVMVKWLSELNFVHATDNRLFRRFDVELTAGAGEEGDALRLDATCHGESVDRSRHTLYTEIKAVTFHGMAVEETSDGWTVQVIFDM